MHLETRVDRFAVAISVGLGSAYESFQLRVGIELDRDSPVSAARQQAVPEREYAIGCGLAKS